MHCTVAFLDEYPLPDSFELKSFMLTLVCLLNYHISFGLKKTLPESYLLKRNYAMYPFSIRTIFLTLTRA